MVYNVVNGRQMRTVELMPNWLFWSSTPGLAFRQFHYEHQTDPIHRNHLNNRLHRDDVSVRALKGPTLTLGFAKLLTPSALEVPTLTLGFAKLSTPSALEVLTLTLGFAKP